MVEKCPECGSWAGLWHRWECSIGGRQAAYEKRCAYEKIHGPLKENEMFVVDPGQGYPNPTEQPK